MKAFEEWWEKNKFDEELAWYEKSFSRDVWRAALEWVLDNTQTEGPNDAIVKLVEELEEK